MKYGLEIRSVARSSQSIAEKHDAFLKGVQDLPEPWGLQNAVPAPDPESALVATVGVRRMLGKGLSGHIVYQYRRNFRDSASDDDYIDITFNPEKIDYKHLLDDAFLRYTSAFDGYYAGISDEEFIYADFDRRRDLKIDDRRAIYRISPISYWREDLCQRAFGLTPKRIVARLQGNVEEVREALDGVLVILTRRPLPTSEMDAICWKAKAFI